MVDINYNPISNPDLAKGWVNKTVMPKPGIAFPESGRVSDLPADDLIDVEMYIPYTKEELEVIEAKNYESDRDEMLLELMYQVTLLNDAINQGGLS